MYYVIKKQHDIKMSSFLCFKISKYIASKNKDTVILEFEKDGKKIRKWIKKDDIILLTDNEDFFMKVRKQFTETEDIQKKLIEDARVELDKSIETFGETMETEIDKFNELKQDNDIPCELKNF